MRLRDLPIQLTNRKGWHGDVERALTELNTAEMISVDDVVLRAGIERSDARLWPAAHLYAKRLLDDMCMHE